MEQVLAPLLERGLLAICGVIELELLYGARNGDAHQQMRYELESGLEWLATEDADFRRAIEVQGLLAAKANHRAAPIPHLLVAAVAERHRVTLVHYDANFDLIARHTAQPARWIVPRGTLS